MLKWVAIAFGIAGAAAFLVLRHRLPMRLDVLTLLGPGIGVIAFAATLMMHGQIRIFPDRLEIGLHMAGYSIKRFVFRWAQVKAIELANVESRSGYSVYQWSPGVRQIMYGTSGVRLKLNDGNDVLIGSAEPERLIAAIEKTRRVDC